MVIRQYIDEVKLLLRLDKDETRMDDRFYTSIINSQRALFIKNEVNANKTIEDNVVQTIGYLEVVPVVGTTLSNRKIKLLKTKVKIPKPINFKERLALEKISIEEFGGYSVTVVDKASAEWVNFEDYTENDIYAYYDNGYIYIKVPEANFKASLFTHIRVDLICENPILVSYYKDINGKSYYDVERDDYPINYALWEYILGEVVKKLNVPMSIRPTLENDGRENK